MKSSTSTDSSRSGIDISQSSKGSSPEANKNDQALAKASADILSDMLRSQLILNLLERDLEYLPRFISRAVSALPTGADFSEPQVWYISWSCYLTYHCTFTSDTSLPCNRNLATEEM